MDFVKEKINNLNKLKKGILIATILCMIMMFGNWATLWMYFSLFLCDIFSPSSWVEIINILRYGFGIVGLALTFGPIAILIWINKKWDGLLVFSGLSNKKKKLDKELEEENFSLLDLDLKMNLNLDKKIYVSKNYIYIDKVERIFKKGNYDLKIGTNKKSGTIILKDNNNSNSKEINVKFGVYDKQLIELAKIIKENINVDSVEKEKERTKKNFIINKIFFGISILSFTTFFILMNFANLPIGDNIYLMLKSGAIVVGTFNAVLVILFNIIKNKKEDFLQGHFKITNMLIWNIFISLIPLVCYFGTLLAIQTLINIS